MTTTSAIVAVMILVVFTAALLTARDDAPRAPEVTRDEPAAPIAVEQMSPQHTPSTVEATKTVATKTAASPAAQPTAASIGPAIEPEHERVASATISGCLENDEGTFRLTEASGASAPTSRSWKSGFLKKRPAHIQLA